ncbi:MAG: hypothetical protein WCJ62_12460, partial [Flavobacterium sp.]
MSLYQQKYPNNIRTISGLINIIKQDDVTLECNTALGPVGVQLLEIPANYWSTQWKLYIVDKNNNASVNNITVTAPPGVLINGAPTFTINANGASLLLRITSNTNFVAQYSVIGGGAALVSNGANVGTGAGQVFKNLLATIMNFKTIKAGTNITITNNADDITIDSSGGGYSTIQDEGLPLPLQTVIDFQGAGVTATNGFGKTIITIPSGGASSYLFARKNLFIPPTIYIPVAGALTRSVVNGTPMANFDFKNESGVTGFDLVTGQWTVDITGWYSVSAKLITRVDPLSVDSNNNAGTFWMALPPPDGLGNIGIALIN